MSRNHSELFSTQHQELAAFAKAIAHPARIAILEHLSSQSACTCGSLVDVLPLAQATISQHLKALKEVGLIQGEIDGPSVKYCVNVARFQYMQSLFVGMSTCTPLSCC